MLVSRGENSLAPPLDRGHGARVGGLGRFGDGVTRWLYFIVSLAGTAMVGTGLVMWTVKRRQKLGNPDEIGLQIRSVRNVGYTLVQET